MHAAGAPHHLSLKVNLKCLVFWVEHCLKQTFRGELRRKMWTILPRAVSGVRKKKQPYGQSNLWGQSIILSNTYWHDYLAVVLLKYVLHSVTFLNALRAISKAAAKANFRHDKWPKSCWTWAECHALSTWPGAPPVEEAKGGLHSPFVLMDCIVCWSHIDHDPHGLMDLRCSSKKQVYLALICTCLSAFQRLTLHNSKPHVLSNYTSSDESKWFFCTI